MHELGDGFSVGDATIDAQHKEIFSLIGIVVNDIDEKQLQEKLESSLNLLEDYVNVHLAYEEQYMRDHHYPAYDEHIEYHLDFKKQYYTLLERQKEDSYTELLEVIRIWMRSWWMKHILIEDHKYGEFIVSNNSSHPKDESPDFHDTIQK